MGLMQFGKKLHDNRQVIAQGEAECNLAVVSAIFKKNCAQKNVVILFIHHLANKN